MGVERRGLAQFAYTDEQPLRVRVVRGGMRKFISSLHLAAAAGAESTYNR